MSVSEVRPWQISLRALLVLTALAAIWCASLVNANQWWLLVVATVSYLIFMTAIVVIVIGRGSRQTFAVGFLLCGALHWAALRWVDELPTQIVLEKIYYRVGKAGLDVGRGSSANSTGAIVANSPGLLRRGDTGAPVRALQTALNSRLSSLRLTIDGDFGVMTERAVLILQKSEGIAPDGIVTLTTWESLGSEGRRALAHFGVSGFLSASPGEQFVEIGGWLFTLLVAYFGGHLAVAVYQRRRQAEAIE